MHIKPVVTLGSCSIRPSCEEDATLLAPQLREADKREVAASGYTPVEALAKGYNTGLECYTAVDTKGNPFCMYGITDVGKEGVAIWLLGADVIATEHLRDFLTYPKVWLAEVLLKYGQVFNFIDVRNTVHLRWLRHMGFNFGYKRNLGINGEMFQYFWKDLP